MQELNPKVDIYLEEGCGRCSKFRTPQCNVHRWQNELIALRKIVLETGLKEEIKWSYPCYTHNGKNILMLGALNNYATLSFFKGQLLKDEFKLLVTPGENSQSYALLQVTDFSKLSELKDIIKSYIFEAIENEEKGLKIIYDKSREQIPIELAEYFNNNPEVQEAFTSLTPGRQRGYIIYFSAPKQSATRTKRIESMVNKIMSGKGFHD